MSGGIGTALTVLAVALLGGVARAYDVETHKDISAGAFQALTASGYLSSELHVDSDYEYEGPAPLPPLTVRRRLVDWVRQGAEDEDDTVTLNLNPVIARYRHHFYNSLNDSGLDFGIVTGLPSPVWGIEFAAISGQDFSFTDARGYFYATLTAANPKDRQHSLAKTFLTLGHVIHLIQDAAQPQHTRKHGQEGGEQL